MKLERSGLIAAAVVLANACSDRHPAGECEQPHQASECFFGADFAECPGPKAPRIFCDDVGLGGPCVWVSTGCPVGGRVIAVTVGQDDCSCDGGECEGELGAVVAQLLYRRGLDPWDRYQEMNLAVSTDAQVSSPGEAISCKGCGSECEGYTPCTQPQHVTTKRVLAGTIVIEYLVSAGWWYLQLEIDPERNTARLCRLGGTDVPRCPQSASTPWPDCATSGKVIFSGPANNQTELAQLRGTFEASFSGGLSVSGSL